MAWRIAWFLILVVAITLVMLALFGKVVARSPHEPSTMKPARTAPVTQRRESSKSLRLTSALSLCVQELLFALGDGV
jgi:hypothetical protein